MNTMKKVLIFSFILFLLLTPNKGFSQAGVEITGYTGWMLGGKVNFYNGSIKIEDGQNWGIIAGYETAPDIWIEVMYNRLVSNLEVREFASDPYVYTKLATNYIQVGGIWETMTDTKFRPFMGASLGTTIFSDQEGYESDRWRFSFALSGGIKIFPIERIGFRLQARLLVPLYFNGIWVGSGGSGAYASSTIVQGDFTGGIIIAF